MLKLQNISWINGIKSNNPARPDSIIKDCKPDFSKFEFINKGLWFEKDSLKFYKPINEK